MLPLLAILDGKVVGNGTYTIAVLRGRQVLSTGKAVEVMIKPGLQHRVSLGVMATHAPNGVGRWRSEVSRSANFTGGKFPFCLSACRQRRVTLTA